MPTPTTMAADPPAVTGEGPGVDGLPRTTGDPFAEVESGAVESVSLRFEWGQLVELRDGDLLELGRDPTWCSLAARMPDNISSQHCRIQVLGSGVAVTDLGSTNGTFVDGRRIEPWVAVPMRRDCRLASDPPVLITMESTA